LGFAILEGDFGLAGDGLAQAITVGNDIGRFEIEEIQYGEVESRHTVRVVTCRKLDVGVGSGYTRPFHIERGFDLVSVLTWVLTVGIDLRERGIFEPLETEYVAKGRPVGFVGEVGVFDQGNGHTRASESTLPQRQDVVDGVEIEGADCVDNLSMRLDVEAWMPLMG